MKIGTEKEIKSLISTLKWKFYKVFERPYELNIIGMRSDNIIPNKFNDQIFVFWKDDNKKWQGKIYPATTDPGTYWLLNPMNNLGTAIVEEGQYINAYQIGMHQGQYKALVQRGNLNIIRDYQRNAVIDFFNGNRESGSNFGINIHRANASGTTVNVGEWSAGCQVFANADDFADFMAMCDKQSALYGNQFTYTLIDERQFNRMLKRRGIYTGVFIVFTIGGLLYLFRKKIPDSVDITL